jgi:hypothetical protein
MTRERAGIEREAPAGSLVDIVYCNETGRVSRRRVEVVRWSHGRKGFIYLRAYCFLREEERTFRTDRIVERQVVERKVVERQVPELQWPVVAFVPVELPTSFPTTLPTPGRVTAPAAVVSPGRPATATPMPLAGIPVPAAPKRKRGGWFLSLLGVAAAALLARGLSSGTEPSVPYKPPAPVPYTAPATVPPKPTVVPAQRPAPKPAPVEPVPDRSAGEREIAFRAATGITSPGLEKLYRNADQDGDGTLDWGELAAFQSRIHRTFAYRSNRLALRPDEFLAQGGGDCEDWALFTCGLLRYWGWDPYVGRFAGSESGTGHAVCLVRVSARPAAYRAWSVDADGLLGGYPVKAGWYVPVDYDIVGDISNAVEDGWRLRVIWTPERIFGEEM